MAIAAMDLKNVSPRGRRRIRAVLREPGSVSVDEVGASCTRYGKIERIRWADVQSLEVHVIPRRFHAPDVVIMLRDKPGGDGPLLMFDDETPLDFLVHLQTLPGLDLDQLDEVLQTKPVGKTVCWSRDAE